MIVEKNSITVEYQNIYKENTRLIRFPIFQRGYTWKKEQVINFCNELSAMAHMDNDSRNKLELHFMDIIHYTDANGIKNVADGQQRMVTLNILMLCINEFIDSNSLDIDKLKLFNLEYEDIPTQEKYKKFFVEKKTSSAPFGNVYRAMKDFIENNQDIIGGICDIIKNNIFVFSKKTSGIDDAFLIFTQINSGGKPLSKDDVIKTTLNQYSRKYGRMIDNYNFKDIKNLIKSYAKLKIGPNGGNFNNLAIMSFLNEEIVRTPETFKRFCSYLDTVKEVNKHPMYYISKSIGKESLINILYASSIQDQKILKDRKFRTDIMMPMLLLSIIWKIKNINPGGKTSNLQKQVMEAIKQGRSLSEIQNIILKFIDENEEDCKISFDRFVKGLDESLNQEQKKALFVMDVIRCNESSQIQFNTINLEHIFPQRPNNDWGMNGWPMNQDDQQKLINSIGNYMLLSEAVNKKIQNKYISEKRTEYERIIPIDKGIQTAMNTIDFDAFEKDKGKYIEERKGNIARIIQSEFPCGKKLIVD